MAQKLCFFDDVINVQVILELVKKEPKNKIPKVIPFNQMFSDLKQNLTRSILRHQILVIADDFILEGTQNSECYFLKLVGTKVVIFFWIT